MKTEIYLEDPIPTAVQTSAGDLLLTFHQPAENVPSRVTGGEWQLAREAGDGRLWQTAVAGAWRGSPLLAVRTPDWSAWLLGELYGTLSPEKIVADVLEQRRPAAELNGHFLLLAHHDPSGEWHVWTNRGASFHAYLADVDGRLTLGTYFPAVAAMAQTGLDWDGLTSFFGLGFVSQDRTLLGKVRILRPATHIIISAAGEIVNQESTWTWWHDPDYTRSYDDTIDEFAARFEAVMVDLTASGQIALPISGGLDSRSTVAALDNDLLTSSRVWSYSYGFGPNSIETKLAGQIAATRNLNFQTFEIPPYLFGRVEQVTRLLEGFVDMTQGRQAGVTDRIAQHADALIAAHLGDLYLDDMGLAATDGRSVTEDELLAHTFHKVKKPGSQWLLDHLCQPQMDGQALEPLMRDMVAGELRPTRHIEDPDFRVKAYKVDQWCARWSTASLRLFQAAAFPRMPFYDNRLTDFFCTVPTSYVTGRRLQIDYLKRYAPDLARVPWQVTGKSLFDGYQLETSDLPRRAWRKGWRILRRQKVIERNWEVQFMSEDGRHGLSHWLLRPGLQLHKLVAPTEIKQLLEAFYRDPLGEKRGYTVSMLLSFSAWLELQSGSLT